MEVGRAPERMKKCDSNVTVTVMLSISVTYARQSDKETKCS